MDLSTLRQIFQQPRLHTGSGYHKKLTSTVASHQNIFCIGDRAKVRGYADCTVLSERLTSGSYKGKIKIKSDDSKTCAWCMVHGGVE